MNYSTLTKFAIVVGMHACCMGRPKLPNQDATTGGSDASDASQTSSDAFVMADGGSDSGLADVVLDVAVDGGDVSDAAPTVVDNTLFIDYMWTAMKEWVPVSRQCYWNPDKAKYQKCLDDADIFYREIAATIVEVIQEPLRLPITGDNSRVKSALLMASIASTESRFEKKVDTCQKIGDDGASFGLWQTMLIWPGAPTRFVICHDRKAALRYAISIVNGSFDACKNSPLRDRLSVYASGSCNNPKGIWHSRRKINRAIDYLAAHPFTW